jgi:hypothetical protein
LICLGVFLIGYYRGYQGCLQDIAQDSLRKSAQAAGGD